MTTVESRNEALLGVAKMLSSAKDVEELLYRILKQARGVMESEICSVLMPVNEAGDLKIRSTFEHPAVQEFTIPAGKGISGEVFRSKKPIHIRDASQDPRFFSKASQISGIDVRAMLTIPLLDGERCMGVLQVLNPNHGGTYSQEDEDVFETFGSLCAVTLMRLEAQEMMLREVQRKEQMGLAREIQNSFLPARSEDFGDLQLRAFYEPASAIGGDFYFWHELDDDLLLFGIGDVTGKGLPAALDMARGSTLIASLAYRAREMSLGDWLTLVNKGLCDVMTAGRFIGISAVLVSRSARKVQLCVAGLPAPMVDFDGRWREVEAPGNPPLGIACSMEFQQLELPLVAGRHWLIFSDGILEEANERGEFFEDGSFGLALDQARSLKTADEVCELLSQRWRAFGGEDPNYRDDATLIVVTDMAPSLPTSFAFTCCPDTICEGRKFVENWALYCGFGEKDSGLVVMGCDEIMNNVVRHAFDCEQGELGGKGPVWCHMKVGPESLVIRIEHHGRGISDAEFSALTRDPDPEARVGGMGLFVVDQVFDAVRCFPGDPAVSAPAWIELEKRW